MVKKRFRKVRKRTVETKQHRQEPAPIEDAEKTRVKRDNLFLDFYDKNYKQLLIIPFLLLLLAFGQIGYQLATTGEFITKGVSLKGGTTVTIPTEESIDTVNFKEVLEENQPGNDFDVRILKTAGMQTAIIVESDITEKEDSDSMLMEIEDYTDIEKKNYNVDIIGSSLGESFFKEIMLALLIAFVFMGIVVFLYFRTIVPSLAVILAAFSDMVITVAIINIAGIRVSTAGIAAFLMLIGYSIDTDILLSTRLIKRKQGTIFDRIIQSAKTGLTMNFTTLAAVTIVLLLSKSEVLTQIMTILLIGLLVDLVNTWIQNAGILRWYLEGKKNE